MSAIELLAEYVRLRKRIRLLQAQINVKREIAEALSGWPEGERVQSSHDPDKIGRVVADLADREDELIKLKLEAIDRMEEIEDLLRELENPDFALVLEYKYVRGMSWDDVAESMNYSTRWVQELKRKAIKEIDRRLLDGRSNMERDI